MKPYLDAIKEEFFLQESEELERLLLQLCKIPAPLGKEEKRAEFCKQYLEQFGANVSIDSAGNVIFPYQLEQHEKVIVLMAHMDTVFSEDTILEPRYEEGKIFCPGIGDDTANLAVLLMLAKYVILHQPKMKYGILFVADTGEEGLGNLRGSRQILSDYKENMEYMISFDLHYNSLIWQSVGSIRYQVDVAVEGGHSYSDFGKKNAIAVLSQIIQLLYEKEIIETDSMTTYNVGTIQGGTTINCIASKANMTYEIRSDSDLMLKQIKEYFNGVIDQFRSKEVEIDVSLLGIRPCSKGVPQEKQKLLASEYAKIIEGVTGKQVPYVSASTDCNMPLSEGIPAICFGVCDGGGVHTTGEWITADSLLTGFQLGLACINNLEC